MDYEKDSYYTNLIREDVEINDPLLTDENPSQSSQTDSTTKKPQKVPQLSVEEDCLLVSAWLNIQC